MSRNRASRAVTGAALACVILAGYGVSAEAADYKVLHFFGSGSNNDGDQPSAGLINVGGVLYGTTQNGYSGSARCNPTNPSYVDGCGTVFSITRAGTEAVRYSFLDIPDGSNPTTSLLFFRGKLYGTTFHGGNPVDPPEGIYEKGTVFTLAPNGVENVIYKFTGTPDGMHPSSALIDIGSILYGATGSGGIAGHGTIYSLAANGTETVLYSFTGGSDGEFPSGNLINVNGVLYGVTSLGGTGHCPEGCGTVFSITPAGVETVLFSLQGGLKGAGPDGGLLLVGSELYGTTTQGGANNGGTVFSLTLDGVPTASYSLSYGSSPNGPLINVGGILYGTTFGGGSGTGCFGEGCGTVFSMSQTGAFTVLYNFQGGPNDGGTPDAGLTDVGGVLYGTTLYSGKPYANCGSYQCGTVFSIKP